MSDILRRLAIEYVKNVGRRQNSVCTNIPSQKQPLVGAPPNDINIYSLTQKPKQDTLDMIVDYHSSNSKDLKFNIMNVQRQESAVDCGAFALAFRMSILAFQDPSSKQMEFSNPRGHLAPVS